MTLNQRKNHYLGYHRKAVQSHTDNAPFWRLPELPQLAHVAIEGSLQAHRLRCQLKRPLLVKQSYLAAGNRLFVGPVHDQFLHLHSR